MIMKKSEVKEREYEIIDKISINKILKYTGQWNRKDSCIAIEKTYLDLMNQFGMVKSDLINDLLEAYFKDLGLINIDEFLNEEQKRRLNEKAVKDVKGKHPG